MRILRLCIVAAAVMLLVAVGFAHAGIENAGTTAANFLTLGSGARILSMGGATLGLGDDLAAGAWNCAALGWTDRTEFVLSHAGLEHEGLQEWAAMSGRFGASPTRWAVTGLYQGDGSFEGRDASNNPTGTFSVSSMALGAQLAHRIGSGISVGLGAKSVVERLGDVSGFGFTFDGGLMYRMGPIGAGVSMTNVGGQMKYADAVYSFPASYGAGVAYTHAATGIRLALDANFPKAYYSDVRFGAEWLYHDMLAVRTGYRHEMSPQPDVLTGPTFGLGAGRNGLWVDYGYLVSSQGESQHRMSLKFTPGGGTPSLGATTVAGRTVERARVAAKGPSRPPALVPAPAPAPAPKAAPAATVVPPAASAGAKKAPEAQKTAEPAKTPAASGTTPDSTKAATAKGAEPAKTAATAKATVPAKAPEIAKAVGAPAKIEPARTGPAPGKGFAEPARVAPAPAKASPEPVRPPSEPAKVAPEPARTAAPVTPEPAKTAAPATPEPAKATEPAKAPEPAAVQEDKPEKQEAPKPAKPAKPRPTKITVKGKETLAEIASRWGVSPAAIMMENNLTSEKVRPGQSLKLPPERR